MSLGPEVLIVAGEASGDALGGELVAAAGALRPDVRFFGATGALLEAAGAERVVATRELAVMGLVEVVGHLPAIWRALRRLEAEAAVRRPAGAILIDAPDFNLRLAGRLHARGIPVIGYVSPSVWAWRAGRIRSMERSLRRLLVTLPFEPAAYAGSSLDVVYVGHPAVDRVATGGVPAAGGPDRAALAARLGLLADAPWVALLPGSRAAELGRLGSLFAEAAAAVQRAVPTAQFLAPVAPTCSPDEVAEALAGGPAVTLVTEDRYAALGGCRTALAKSGTGTLGLALLGVPHAVAYQVAPATFALARLLVDTRHVGLPNLIAGRTVVPEFLQAAATPDALAAPLITWLTDTDAWGAVAAGLRQVRDAVGPPGAAGRAARAALEALELVPAAAA
ncbi:MAG: lipid-A-disaccharide synthase [Gemmatimonadota bacterium]